MRRKGSNSPVLKCIKIDPGPLEGTTQRPSEEPVQPPTSLGITHGPAEETNVPPTPIRARAKCSICHLEGHRSDNKSHHPDVKDGSNPDADSLVIKYMRSLEELREAHVKIIALQSQLQSLTLAQSCAVTPVNPVQSYADAAAKPASFNQPSPAFKRPAGLKGSKTSKPSRLPEFRISCDGDSEGEVRAKKMLADSDIAVISVRVAPDSVIVKLPDATESTKLLELFKDWKVSPVELLLPEVGIILPKDAEGYTDAELVVSLEMKNGIRVQKFLKRTPHPSFCESFKGRLQQNNAGRLYPL